MCCVFFKIIRFTINIWTNVEILVKQSWSVVNINDSSTIFRYVFIDEIFNADVAEVWCLHGTKLLSEPMSTKINGTVTLPAVSLHWRHNDHGGVSNHQPRGCLLDRLFRRRWRKTSKLRVTGLCVGNSPGPVNSPHKGPVTRKCFHLMTSSCHDNGKLELYKQFH